MFAWLRKPNGSLIFWATSIFLLMPLLASCSPNANAKIISPSLGALEVQEIESGFVEAAATAVPLTLADFEGADQISGLPEGVAAAMASADLRRGQTLHTTQACVGCHMLEPGIVATGPTWVNLGNTAAQRTAVTADASPGLYLYDSIANPNVYIVPGYNSNVMPGDYSDKLSDQDFADLIAFILSQTGS